MATIAARVLDPLRELSTTVRVLRAPLLLGLLSLFVLSLPAQILELYLILARDWGRLGLQVTLAFLSLAGLTFFIAHVSRALTRTDEDANATRSETTAQGAITRNMPIILGLLPLVGCVIGLYRALQSTSTEGLRHAVEIIAAFKTPDKVMVAVRKLEAALGTKAEYNETVIPKLAKVLDTLVPQALLELPARTAELSIAIYAGIAICIALALLLIFVLAFTSASLQDALRTRVFHPVTSFGSPLVFIAVTALFAAQYLNVGHAAGFDFTSIPRALGTMTLVNLSMIFLVFFCSLLTRWSDRNRIPLLSPLIALAVAFSLFNLNDNHSIRLTKSSAADLAKRKIGEKVPPLLTDAFEAWLAGRPAEYLKKFEGKPYPIYVAAAQGGGMYAANLSGLALARLYDRCPAIRHHLFAVSAVSGGSVGAGYLAALLNDPTLAPRSDTCGLDAPVGGKGSLERKMEELLRTDFLSPVAASFLFPDLLQRFLPYPIDAFDRARAFEAGLEKAYDSVMKSPSNPLRMPFWHHWRPDGASPMLLLNTTVVETGHQVAVAPVEIDPNAGFKIMGLESFQEFFGLRPEIDVPLSTAMSLSARFPLVMPAGLLRLPNRNVRLVDGGYFENSGAEVASALVRRFCPGGAVDYSNCERTSGDRKQTLAFKLLVLTDYDDQADVLRDPVQSDEGLNEILSPVRTMFNSRIARGDLIVGRMRHFRSGWYQEPGTIPTVLVTLNPRLYQLPLGWQLSSQVQSIVGAQIGDAASCGYGPEAPSFKEAWAIISGIERGLNLVKDEANKRDAALDIFSRSSFQTMLYKLKDNHCGIFDALGHDGIAPIKSRRAAIHMVSVEFRLDPPPEFGKLSERTGPYKEELKRKWVAEVAQKHGAAWAILERATDGEPSCGSTGSEGLYSCELSVAPVDPAYFEIGN